MDYEGIGHDAPTLSPAVDLPDLLGPLPARGLVPLAVEPFRGLQPSTTKEMAFSQMRQGWSSL